jgi:hypothetical protein
MQSAPSEYGFYANVNPTVDHPRWSQGGSGASATIRPRETLMFNGYDDRSPACTRHGPSQELLSAITLAVWAFCLFPAARLLYRAGTGGLTANPIEYLTLQTGWWALVLLMVTLAVTPLRRVTGWNRVIRYRRTFGVFAFFYATCTWPSTSRWTGSSRSARSARTS